MNNQQRFSLTGRVALITGASSGIGLHLAKALAAAGACVAVCARRENKLHALVADINSHGGKAAAIHMDVSNGDSVRTAIDRAEQQLGVVNILINNAGVADPKRFLTVSENDFDQLMNVNLRGAWLVAQEVARRLVNAKQPGSIINVASILGLGAHIGQASYSASKAAIIHLTKALAQELIGDNIRVNAIAPGWFNTEMNQQFFDTEKGRAMIAQSPPGRAGELDELVGPVLLLASDAGSYVNGAVIPIDGGHHSRLA